MLFNINFIILDAARLESGIFKARELNKDHLSLYRGNALEEFADVSPYLFTMQPGQEIVNWYMQNGWGNSWGVSLYSSFTFEQTYNHFRRFLMVKTETSEELYFRFYDPRVLKIFLPTCDKSQILEFFGPVESFIVEGDNKDEAIRFSQQDGELNQEVLPIEMVFGITNQKTQA